MPPQPPPLDARALRHLQYQLDRDDQLPELVESLMRFLWIECAKDKWNAFGYWEPRE